MMQKRITPMPDFDARVLDTLVERSHEHLLVADSEGRVLRASPSCCAIYGLDPGQVVGRSVHELEREGTLSPSVTARVLASGAPAQVMQTTRDGRRVLAEGFPVQADGRLVGVVSLSRDLTDLQLLQREFEGLQRRYAEQLRRAAGAPPGGSEAAADSLGLRSPAMREIAGLVHRIADSDASVLLLGESGVGKTVLARQLHAWSERAGGPLVEINCGAIPEPLFESEVFGYGPGAFTGASRQGKPGRLEQAHGGTLFLDEVGELPLAVQGKLLSVLQDRRVLRVGESRSRELNFRLVVASNRDLRQQVADGGFRLDLYYRLNVVPITVPPLRERREDIPPLVEAHLARLNARYGASRVLDTRAWPVLLQHDWPGNVRELENLLERWFVASEGDVVGPAGAGSHPMGEDDLDATGLGAPRSLAEALRRTERAWLTAARQQCASTYAMARQLGISQPSVVRKLRRHGLRPPA